MAGVEITGLSGLIGGLTELQSNLLPKITIDTLNDLAQIGLMATRHEMALVFDRPTPFTLNSLRIVGANTARLQSEISLRDEQRNLADQHYLNPQVGGGERWFKKFEGRLYKFGFLPRHYYAVPASGADFDAYGNMSRGQIVQILAFFDTFLQAGFRANMGDAGRARLLRGTRNRYGFEYFVVKPGDRSRFKPGIYKRANLASGANVGPAAPVRPVLLFVQNVRYRKRLDLQKIATEVYQQNFEEFYSERLMRALADALPG